MFSKGIVAVLIALTAALGAVLAAVPAAAAGRTLPLLPLGRGQVAVLLGQTAQWQPQAGVPQELTLIGGPPRAPNAGGLNAYVALQPVQRPCAGSARADRARLMTIAGFYRPGHLVGSGSPLAPTGGAGPGVYAAEIAAGVLRERGAVRACVWVAGSPGAAARPVDQTIPLLNGLFAASAWTTDGPAGGYSLDAAAVGTSFSYAARSVVCGAASSPPRVNVPTGQDASETISVGSLDCPTDGSVFSFFAAGGRELGTLVYTDTDALAAPSLVAHLGGCDLNGVAGLPLAAAQRYVSAVGCRVARVLAMPYDHAVVRGQAVEAQIDGGLATVAPPGTAVDLVIDGR